MSLLILLACFQTLLYAGMWALAWLVIGDERRAVGHWLIYSLALGLGLGLMSQRPDMNPWWTDIVANLALLLAFVCAQRGMLTFLRLPEHSREMAVLCSATLAGMLMLGPIPQPSGWIHPGYLVAATIGWLVLSTTWRTHRALREHFGGTVPWVVGGTNGLIGVINWIRVAMALLVPQAIVPLHIPSTLNVAMVYMTMGTAAIFNFMFLFLIVLRLLRRLTVLVQRDALTGLFNRRAMEQMLDRAWSRWRRMAEPFTVVTVDLDHFKSINDTWGHHAGDEVLKAAAGKLVASLRAVDVVGRVGGEEFLAVLEACPSGTSLATAERLRQAIGAEAVPVDDGLTVAVTASVGVATVLPTDSDIGQMLRRSDAALYRAKREGRNRVCVASDDEADAVPVGA
ncbi:MAG TPA: GGDEF domain-containing protein [Burkholderiaceae bacterium]|nr:GGDEF domain-containing protein [Burkholderiaceae bacterium]HMX09428.1 GGDEF domain-containing protein [Burkholderiaceae bacterium]HMZ00107.1 GGDEF domain-containing protein [Burkholderiaceae bacterium]HNB45696.1 GGDEF domain-containing protein [Burkholderiaceae bacterium]HNG81305.1 GGDEF domain-containing protein [Burkholderiaceae bacterium]